MRAWVVKQFGQPAEALALEDLPTREPGPAEVVLDIAAASLGFADLLLCAGKYQIQPEPPFTPGFECAGTVAAVGTEVTHVQPGQRVIALPTLGDGVLREQSIAPAAQVHPIPDSLGFEAAAALFVSYQTAMLSLHRRGHLQAGETVLVHGATGGVGSACIEVARAAGARVIAAARGGERAQLCETLGAERGIDVNSEDFVAVVKELTGGRGADVIVDPVGGATFEQSVKCIAPEGRLLVIGFASGKPGELKLNHLLVKNFSAVGVFFGPSPLAAQLNREYHAQLMAMQTADQIHPLIEHVLDLDDAPAGLERLAAGGVDGKIVVRVR